MADRWQGLHGHEPLRAYPKRRGIGAAIPRRAGPDAGGRRRLPVDPGTRRRRDAVERAVGWSKGRRSTATRRGKLALSFLAMLRLAFLRQHPRARRGSQPSGTT